MDKDIKDEVEEKVSEVKVTPKNTAVKVRLLAPHVHEGIGYDIGDIVELDPSSATYVVETAKTGVRI